MSENTKVKMYEAQAIAAQRQLKMNELEAEKKALEKKIKKLELEKSTISNKLDEVWTAMNKLQTESRMGLGNLEEKIDEMRKDTSSSQEAAEENSTKSEQAIKQQIVDVNLTLSRKLDIVRDIQARTLLEMNKFKEETHSLQEKMRKDLTDVKQQVKRNTDQAGSLQLQISKVFSKVDQIQETITNEGIRLDSIARTMDLSENTKLKTILIMGGRYNYAHRTMTVLSTDRSDWIELQLELPYDVDGSGAVFLQNELYVVGGFHNLKALYKLEKNLEWKRLADMNVGRRNIANSCLELNGYIWVFGGTGRYLHDLKSVERYDPKEDKWTLMPEMSTARSNAAAVFWKDRIIVCGGWSEGGRITSSAECFLLETGKWTQFPPLPDDLVGHSLVSFENKLILMGGWNSNEYEKSVWEMDPLRPKDGWKSLPPMKYSRDSFPGLVLDQEIYAVGGRGDDNTVLDRVEIFDGKSWRDGPSLPYQRHLHSAVVIPQSLADRLCQ